MGEEDLPSYQGYLRLELLLTISSGTWGSEDS